MNLATLHHPKTHDLAAALHEHFQAQGVPLGRDMCHTYAVGLLERLWLFAQEYAPAGDVGRHSDARLARALGWSGDVAWLIATLVELRWLDRRDAQRLVVHDWAEHCPRSCDQRLADCGATFADGQAPRRRPRRGSPAQRAAALAESGRKRKEEERREMPVAATGSPPPASSSSPASSTAMERPCPRTADEAFALWGELNRREQEAGVEKYLATAGT